MIQGLYHIGVYTKDLEQSMEFYSQILSFTVKWRGIVDHPTMGKMPVAVVELGGCIIELVQPANPDAVAKEAGPVQHIALKVEDINTLAMLLKDKGIQFYPDEIENLPSFWKGIKHIFIYGPSNERIELVEEY
ncbi:MAG: lactoylglutathione lyase [Clostridiales bacterium]|nr:lactoylglutathione lyase [Clostridiales bacterium]